MMVGLALVGTLYALVGFGVACRLLHEGHDLPVVAASLVAWPMFVALLGETPEPQLPRGPLAVRIDQSIDRLANALADPAAHAVRDDLQLEPLRATLRQMDARLAFVDGLIAQSEATEGAARLAEARAETVAGIDTVLAELHELRLMVGLLSLEGDPAVVRDRWQQLTEETTRAAVDAGVPAAPPPAEPERDAR